MNKKVAQNLKEKEKKRLSCLKEKIIKNKSLIDSSISFLTLIATIVIAVFAHNISKESNELNKRQQPLVYEIKAGEEDTYYEINNQKLPCKSPILKVNQGTINMLKIIKFDGSEFKVLGKPDYDFIYVLNEGKNVMNMQVEQNLTDISSSIIYDYFFIYIKSGDGLNHLDLIYTRIDVNNKTIEGPFIITKLDLLQNSETVEEDWGYFEMLDVYKKLQNKISELPQNEMDVY